MINNKAHREYLIKSFISKGIENSLTLDNTNLKTNVNGIIIPVQNILRQKYRGIILQNCIEIELDGATFEIYKYKPKMLSLKLYGTTDLWHMILWLNNMTSVTEFKTKKLLLLDPDAMSTINKIIDREKDNLNANHENPDKIIVEEKAIRR